MIGLPLGSLYLALYALDGLQVPVPPADLAGRVCAEGTYLVDLVVPGGQCELAALPANLDLGSVCEVSVFAVEPVPVPGGACGTPLVESLPFPAGPSCPSDDPLDEPPPLPGGACPTEPLA